MDEEMKNAIEQLEAVVLTLHRSAGELDTLVQDIKRELTMENAEYLYMYIKNQCHYREMCKQVKGYNQLDEAEKIIWDSLNTAAAMKAAKEI